MESQKKMKIIVPSKEVMRHENTVLFNMFV